MSARFTWAPGGKTAGGEGKKIVGTVAATLLANVKTSHRPGFGWDTGNLANSYTAVPAGPLSWVVGTSVSYAPFVEYGTRYMAPQQHLTRAAQSTAAAFPGVIFVGGGA